MPSEAKRTPQPVAFLVLQIIPCCLTEMPILSGPNRRALSKQSIIDRDAIFNARPSLLLRAGTPCCLINTWQRRVMRNYGILQGEERVGPSGWQSTSVIAFLLLPVTHRKALRCRTPSCRSPPGSGRSAVPPDGSRQRLSPAAPREAAGALRGPGRKRGLRRRGRHGRLKARAPGERRALPGACGGVPCISSTSSEPRPSPQASL